MYTQVKSDKRGVSLMIGYIVLVTVAIIMSTIIYQQLKTYVPSDEVSCSEGVSVFIESLDYSCSADQINLTIKNTGRFSFSGYFISAADSPGETVATIDLSQYNELGSGGVVFIGLTGREDNPINPGREVNSYFDLPDSLGQLYAIELTPARYEEISGIKRLVSCGDARIREEISC